MRRENLLALVLLVAACHMAVEVIARAADPPDLAVNTWTPVARDLPPGYDYSAPIYVPSRGAVLHWGAVAIGDRHASHRNDVLALDAGAFRWRPDYPRAAKLPGLNHPYGKGAYWKGAGAMLGPSDGVDPPTPAPSMIVHGVCYDSKRDQIVYVMPGLMAAYDVKTKRWRDMKADNVPRVYGPSIAYDPVNDEVVMFPHWGGFNTDLRGETGQVSAHEGTWGYRFSDNTWRRTTDHNDEPPPRTGTPLVYHPRLKAVVMFGGHSGLVRTDIEPARGRSPMPQGLNDTWLYDCATRRWVELMLDRRPPPTRLPRLAYDPGSQLILLVTRSGRHVRQSSRVITLWGLKLSDQRRAADAPLRSSTAQWLKLHEQPWPWNLPYDWFDVTLDERAGMLVLSQNAGDYRNKTQQLYAYKLDAAALLNRAETAPQYLPPPPIQPHSIPADDPRIVNKLRQLPANTWVHVDPPRDTPTRDWGNAACDPVRGWVVYFGGGHSTYQVNDVAVYNPGANRWSHAVGEHNDWLPPVRWGGVTMGYRGGPHAHHQRNEYVALDGRVYERIGTFSARWGRARGRLSAEPQPGDGAQGERYFVWYYNVDQGGVWRMKRIERVQIGEGVTGAYAVPHMVDPNGRVLGFGGLLEPYDGRVVPKDLVNFAAYDVKTNTLSLVKVSPPHPGHVYECRPFCYLPDRDQVFFYEYRDKGDAPAERTWVYDVKSNRFSQLRPKRQPGGEPRTVEYIADQGVVFAVIGQQRRQWLYSLEHNTWKPLPMKTDRPMGFAGPYAQVVYDPIHRVLVNVGSHAKGTAVMRPDFAAINWH